jgi:hypothetical protein
LIFERQSGKIAAVLVALLVALPFGVSYVFSSRSHAAPLKLYLSGAVANAGNQSYSYSGGKLISARILNYSVNPLTARLAYSVRANVTGLTSTGTTQLNLSGTFLDGKGFELSGAGIIVNSTSAAELPFGCAANCTSEIPSSFVSLDNLSLDIAGNTTRKSAVPVALESPYLDPFGGPLVQGTSDGQIILIANYTSAKIDWVGAILAGTVVGNFGSSNSSVSGVFSAKSNNSEDLVAGTQTDRGTVSLYGMSPSAFDSFGALSGNSSIPASSLIPCPPSSGMPEGSCSQSGLASTGSVSLSSAAGAVAISGSYITVWATPAITSSSSIGATETGV